MPPSTVELLDRLVAFPTVPSASNLDLVDFVADVLAGHGIEPVRIPDATGAKAALHAVVGPAGAGGVLLSAHTDVVPAAGQPWTGDPFRLREVGGRLVGRGTADMKGFLASAVAAACRAAAMDLAVPLRLAFSYDEEIGCAGVGPLLDALAAAPVRPALVVVGEPTSMRVATGHKGKTALRATCRGRDAHSALAPTGLNAIHLAADFVARIRARQEALEREGARDEAYAVPYTTLHVGTIAGGTALNVVPGSATMELEIRNLAADDPATILAALSEDAAAVAAPWRPAFPEADVRLEVTNAYPGLAIDENDPAVAFVRGLAGHDDPLKLAFGTEAGLYAARLGVPVVVCGPGSMDQGHKPDEWIARDQLDACDAFLDALLARLAAGEPAALLSGVRGQASPGTP